MSTTTTNTTTFMEVTTMEEQRAELNKAIWTVISDCKLLKDMKAEVKLIKSAGYTICKYKRNQWEVNNPKTKKWVTADYECSRYDIYTSNNRRYEINIRDEHYHYYSQEEINRRALRIDFVGILEKPVNTEWNQLLWSRIYSRCSKTLDKYNRIKCHKNYIKWRNEAITKKQEQIAKLQKELIRDVEQRERYKAELNVIRKELGLKERH